MVIAFIAFILARIANPFSEVGSAQLAWTHLTLDYNGRNTLSSPGDRNIDFGAGCAHAGRS
jgi:hypothetical protein